MSSSIRHLQLVFTLLLLSVLPVVANAGFIKFEVGGSDIASIQPVVDAFRAALGNPNNGNGPGPLLSGRREINWDGGGVATTVSATPFNAFQNNRGARFITPGTGFVQAPPSGLATQFSNATYGTIFSPFSAARLFTPTGSNITDVLFFVPGTTTPATVSGFGAVFSDVDLGTSSLISFFDFNGNLLFSDNVDPATVTDDGLSFLGAKGDAGEAIFRVRITSGTGALGPNDNPGGGVDMVVLDDLIYAEPRTASEPSVAVLIAAGLLSFLGLSRKRARHNARFAAA
jgi:hypothetical protein